jgi:nucleotide-binding universal stress UspA family protein
MYNVIVVGTDGSETAAAAVHHAARLAKMTGATLHIVHAYQAVSVGSLAMAGTLPAWTEDLEEVNAGIADASESVCAHAASQVERDGVEVVTHALPGDPADLLVTVAEDVGADLVVVGNRGMTGVRRFALGSVPNKVSHRCSCNLLIVDTTPT